MNFLAPRRVSATPLAWVLLVSIVVCTPRGASALSVQEAILIAKPAVALVSTEVWAEVTVNCGAGFVTVRPAPFVEMGTAWFVDGRGLLITNAHVVDPAQRLPPWVVHDLKERAIQEGCVIPALKARGLAAGRRPDIEDQIRRRVALATLTLDPSARITVLLSSGKSLEAEVKKFSPPILRDVSGDVLPSSGRDLALLQVEAGVYPALAVATAGARIGDPVHLLGFPGVVLLHEMLGKGNVRLEASVTSGAVSGYKQDEIGQDVVQTDAPAAHGNSGGPAISDDASVVGVMAFVSIGATGGAIVQGFNFLIPAKDVRAFLQGTEADPPGQSRWSPVWEAGVQAYFGERYDKAVEHFREANRLIPDLVDVKRLLNDAELRLKNPPPRPFPWAWLITGLVSCLSLGVYGTMAVRRWRRDRYRVRPSQVIDFMERGPSPLLLDVRSRTDFETSPLTLPGAVRLDPEHADRFDRELERDRMIIAFCTSPDERTSAAVAATLRRRGYRTARVLKGGLGGWTNARLPVEAKSHLPSIGLELYKNLTLGDIERRQFAPGALIFAEGEDARGEAYVLHAGTVEIRKRFDGAERHLNTVHEGELIGEMALFRKAPRSAAAVAVTPVELLVIRDERLEWLIRNRPQLTLEVLKRLSDQIVSGDRDRTAGPEPSAARAGRNG